MNLWDVLILVLVAAAVFLAWKTLRGKTKSGGCSCGCGGCTQECAACREKQEKTDKTRRTGR